MKTYLKAFNFRKEKDLFILLILKAEKDFISYKKYNEKSLRQYIIITSIKNTIELIIKSFY